MKIGIIGRKGNLGSALACLLYKNNFNNRIIFSDNNIDLIRKSNIICICVKPSDMENVLQDIRIVERENTDMSQLNNKLIISCAAAYSIEKMEKYINFPIFRCMMNLPIYLGKGTITYYSNNKINNHHYKILNKLFNGPYLQLLKEEKHLDITTILTGSMPAFFSHLSQEYIKYGLENGLEYKDILKLYSSTIEGTLAVLGENENSLTETIRKVSSRQGITEAGLNILHEHNCKDIINQSIICAHNHLNLIKNKF